MRNPRKLIAKIKEIILMIMLFITVPAFADVNANNCSGNFVNPITDICWECIFPVSIGGFSMGEESDKPDTDNPGSPLCFCPMSIPPFVQPGVAVGFWEPIRLVDVTKRPFCFPNLGGITIDLGFKVGQGKAPRSTSKAAATWHVHWYMYPLIYWLNLITDFICLEPGSLDLLYLTELDPLWEDDELSFLINPEGILFGNLIAQAACSVDCVKASVGLPIDSLFWCAGCQGGMYPLNGHIKSHVGSIQSSLLATERFTYKLHRQFLLKGTSGEEALCEAYRMPIIKKSQYRTQLTNPVPTTGEFGCSPFGRTSTIYESGKEIPVIGEDFGYLIWRKRNCCVRPIPIK